MSAEKRLKNQRRRRVLRVRSRLRNKSEKLRISVFRSLKHIGAQIIDDSEHKTVVSFSSLQVKDLKGNKKVVAKHIGTELGKLAKEKGIKEVFFDRGLAKYHGRIRALAEGLRESGLTF